MNAIHTAIGIFGGQAALAQKCGVTQAAVSKWARGHRISGESAVAIVRAVNELEPGAVTLTDLRPDLWPAQEAA